MGLKEQQDNEIVEHFLKATMSLSSTTPSALIPIINNRYTLCAQGHGIFAKLSWRGRLQ